jgi:hypothetical protein
MRLATGLKLQKSTQEIHITFTVNQYQLYSNQNRLYHLALFGQFTSRPLGIRIAYHNERGKKPIERLDLPDPLLQDIMDMTTWIQNTNQFETTVLTVGDLVGM